MSALRESLARVRGAVAVGSALALAFALVAVLGFAPTLNPVDLVTGRGRSVVLGKYAGRPLPGVESELRQAGLQVTTRTAFSLREPRGTVVAQEPLAGTRVRAGASVELVVSRGASRVTMPDVVGQPLDVARAPLDEAGVTVQVDRRADERLAAGLVLEQDPGPGREVTGDAVARLVVSDGPAPRPVPDVSGRTLVNASYVLGVFGMAVTDVVSTRDTDLPDGAVVGTEPAAGTGVARDTPLKVVVAGSGEAVTLPPLTGQSVTSARDQLAAAGFVPNVLTATPTEAAAAAATLPPSRAPSPPASSARPTPSTATSPVVPTSGTVLSQFPLAGQSALPGTVVSLLVAP